MSYNLVTHLVYDDKLFNLYTSILGFSVKFAISQIFGKYTD